jgi:hypothetical protein
VGSGIAGDFDVAIGVSGQNTQMTAISSLLRMCSRPQPQVAAEWTGRYCVAKFALSRFSPAGHSP